MCLGTLQERLEFSHRKKDMKENREILTRDILQQKLIQGAKHLIIGATLLLVPISIVLGLTYLVVCYSTSPNSFPSIFLLVAIIGTAIIFGIDIIRGAIQLCKARQGEFSIAEESLIKIEAFKFSFWQFFLRFDLQFPILSLIHRPYFNHIFEFESGRKYIVNADEYKETHVNTVAQIAQVGDTMLVVSYNNNPRKIIKIFSPQIYHYKA